MGGKLTLESSSESGTRFNFIIPVVMAGAQDESVSTPGRVVALRSDQPEYRVLVAEDHDASRLLLVKLLQEVGFKVKEAANGRQAVQICTAWQPHLVWMDMRMPEMNGFEAARQIKTNSANQIVVIALTANAFKEDRSLALESGCDDFLRKPFRETEIFGLMQKHLGVAYQFEEGMPTQNDRPASVADLISEAEILPAEMLSRFAEALELSHLEKIEKSIVEIRLTNPHLAEVFSEMADDFAYEDILAVVRKAEPAAQGRESSG